MLALLVWEWRSERHSQICALKRVPGKKFAKEQQKSSFLIYFLNSYSLMRNAVYHFQSIKARIWKNNVLVKSGSARILSLRSHLILGAPLALALSYFLGSAARARAHVLGVALRAALPGARAQQCSEDITLQHSCRGLSMKSLSSFFLKLP